MERESLSYRRQFVIGSEFVDRLGWIKTVVAKNLFLSSHPDIQVTQIEEGNIQLTLIGFFIDPYNPSDSNEQILKRIAFQSESFDDVILNTETLGGRWALIFKNKDEVKICHDPCGLRQIYFTRIENKIWCGSQPTILLNTLNFNFSIDNEALLFSQSEGYRKNEYFWPGDGTLYKEIKHLLPNRCLNLKHGNVERLHISNEVQTQDIEEAIKVVSAILKGSLIGAASRSELTIPITAGWDSRLLLAASKEISENVYYYIHKFRGINEKNPDIWVPEKLMPSLGLKFNILECDNKMDDIFLGIFKKNTLYPRTDLGKTLGIYTNYKKFPNKLNITGNGSEIVRSYFYKYDHQANVTGKILAKISNYADNSYVEKQLDKWLNEIPEESNINVWDMFYWENRMGNWGAMYPAEQDIAMEEFSPYNNRKLLTTLLGVDKKYRIPPNYKIYKKIIADLWSDTLKEPINPLNLKSQTKQIVKMSYIKSLKVFAKLRK